jgi:hypothetical protein
MVTYAENQESKVKGRAKMFPVHAMKEYRGSRGIDPLILNVGSGWDKWSTSSPGSFTPRAYNPGTN